MDPHQFYLGNDSVDWIGIDIYQQTNEPFSDDFDMFYQDFWTAPFCETEL